MVDSQLKQRNAIDLPSSSYSVPSFVDGQSATHYHARNVKRREKRKKEKVTMLRQEIQVLKTKLKEKDEVISRLHATLDREKWQIEAAIEKLQKQYDLAMLDFLKLEESVENTSIANNPEPTVILKPHSHNFTFQLKEGRRYSTEIRNLYYSLLSFQIPPAKIAPIIRSVLSTFFPDIDASSLDLPAQSCAGYMRREELKTISSAHQATIPC